MQQRWRHVRFSFARQPVNHITVTWLTYDVIVCAIHYSLTWRTTRRRRSFSTRVWWASERPSSHGNPACLIPDHVLAPVPPSWPEMTICSACPLATPEATTPTPTSDTNLTLMRELGLDAFRLYISWNDEECGLTLNCITDVIYCCYQKCSCCYKLYWTPPPPTTGLVDWSNHNIFERMIDNT